MPSATGRQRRGRGEAVRARRPGTPPRSCGPRVGRLGWRGGGGLAPRAGARTARRRLRLSQDATPEGLGRACSPRIPAAPRAPHPWRGEERARSGSGGGGVAGASLPQSSPARACLRACPRGPRRDPLPPSCCPPPSAPHCSPGKAEGVPRSSLKGPSLLPVSRQVASTSGVGRARRPPPPGPSAQLGSRSPEAGWGHAAPSPVRSPATRPPGRGSRARGHPCSRSRRWAARRRPAAPLDQARGLGRSCERRGLARRRAAAGWAPPAGDRPCADREAGQTSRPEPGPGAGAAASLPALSRGIQGL